MGNETSAQTISLNPVKETCANSPDPREAHAACCFANELWIVGGARGDHHYPLDVAWIWTPANKQWRSVSLSGSIPEPRAAPGFAFVAPHYLVLMGGTTHSVGWTQQVCVLNLASKEWLSISKIEGEAPSPRDKVACCSIGSKMYAFGGFGPRDAAKKESDRVEDSVKHQEEEEEAAAGDDDVEEDEDKEGIVETRIANDETHERPSVEGEDGKKLDFGWSDELWELDCESLSSSSVPLKWRLLSKAVGPTPRAAAAMCALAPRLFVFGGRDPVERRNDLWSFDLTAAISTPTIAPPSSSSSSWRCIDSQSVIPPARSFHTLVSIGSTHLLLFGGLNLLSTPLKDFHLFNSHTSLWSQPSINGTSPTPPPPPSVPSSSPQPPSSFAARGFHSCTLLADHKLAVIFGGSVPSQENTEYFNELITISVESILDLPPPSSSVPASSTAPPAPSSRISFPSSASAQLLAKAPPPPPIENLFSTSTVTPSPLPSLRSAESIIATPPPAPLALWKPSAQPAAAPPSSDDQNMTAAATVRKADSEYPEGVTSPSTKKAK